MLMMVSSPFVLCIESLYKDQVKQRISMINLQAKTHLYGLEQNRG